MMHLQISMPLVEMDLTNYALRGAPIVNQTRLLKDVAGIYADQQSLNRLNPETVTYSVQSWVPVSDETPGGLFFGASTIYPGKVGNEYFMTKGHFHAKLDRAEFYWGVKGEGMLILMDKNRNTWAEKVFPGSLHYIAGGIAHRLANTGNENLVVGACWPSDAGHNYEEIEANGFSARLLEIKNTAVLVQVDDKQNTI